MGIQGIAADQPRRAAWLAALIGILTVAHLWAHATAPYDQHTPSAYQVASPSFPHPAQQHAHGRVAHADLFSLPAPASRPVRQAALIAWSPCVLVVPPVPAVRMASARAPPCGHRARAVRTHTLEVYRP
jgi:hypothetical protein